MEKGTIVRSAAGHDKGRLYVVMGIEEDRLLLADGRQRTLNKPKKKQVKHVEPSGKRVDTAKLLLDAHVRKAIKNFKSEGGCYLG